MIFDFNVKRFRLSIFLNCCLRTTVSYCIVDRGWNTPYTLNALSLRTLSLCCRGNVDSAIACVCNTFLRSKGFWDFSSMICRNLKISLEHDARTFYVRMTLINHMKMDGIVKRSIYTVRFFIAWDKFATRLRYDLRFIDCRRVLKHVLNRYDIISEVRWYMTQTSARKKLRPFSWCTLQSSTLSVWLLTCFVIGVDNECLLCSWTY